MKFKDILYKIEGDYAHITINRPKVLNAFTPITLQELKTTLDMAEKNKNVGVIVLSGSGDKAFCAGGDINWENSKEFQDH
jgi:2-ketocyclohexanecarboxyl-CoA hydrolase